MNKQGSFRIIRIIVISAKFTDSKANSSDFNVDSGLILISLKAESYIQVLINYLARPVISIEDFA